MLSPNNSLFGFYRALVVSAEDPEKKGRVKVHIADIMLDKGWCGKYCEDGIWAYAANNWIGGRNTYDTDGTRCSLSDATYQGSCMPPPKGSHVFVFFEKGDPSHPFYFGSADYGQTKALPENRVGKEYWKKWTPIKTHDGRCMIFSDDPYDCRVEITGKKRKLMNPPDGDPVSVFQIDQNQTVFLIDERNNHEKVFLKDYRGNYVKMIQNENGEHDKMYVHMNDDIHITTPKNIYITAGQDIHITAKKSIYITAMKDMMINVSNNFKEMARNIDTYASMWDKRSALSINDTAVLNCGRSGGVQVVDKAGVTCNRISGAIIADKSGGAYSIFSTATLSLSSMSCGLLSAPITNINNGASPLPVIGAILSAGVASSAQPAKESPNRYLDEKDDEWKPKAPDENAQQRCHQKYWKKTQYEKLTEPSQCEGAKTTPGCSGCTAGEQPQSYYKSSSSSYSSSSNYSPSTVSGTSCSGGGSGCNGSQTQNKLSITDSILDMLKNLGLLSIDDNNVDGIVEDLIVDVIDSIEETTQNNYDYSQNYTNNVFSCCQKSFCNRMTSFYDDVRGLKNEYNNNEIMSNTDDISTQSLVQDITEVVNGCKNTFYSLLSEISEKTIDNVSEALYNSFWIYDLPSVITLIYNNCVDYLNNNTDIIVINFRNIWNNYVKVTETCEKLLYTDYSPKILSDFEKSLDSALKSTITDDNYIDGLDTIVNSFKECGSYISGDYISDYCDLCNSCINMNEEQVSTLVEAANDGFETLIKSDDFKNQINNTIKSEFTGYFSLDNCKKYVENYFNNSTDRSSKAITNGIYQNVLNDVISKKNNSLSSVINVICTACNTTYNIADSGIIKYYDFTNCLLDFTA